MMLRKGVRLLEETSGDGEEVERRQNYIVAIRMTLSQGEIITPVGDSTDCPGQYQQLVRDGYYVYRTYVHRECLLSGVFYALQGMRVGGYRRVRISPHLAYGAEGPPGKRVPPNACLTVDLHVLTDGDQKPASAQQGLFSKALQVLKRFV